MAQYGHALNSSDVLVDVCELDEAQRHDTFTCPDCHSRLILSWKNDIKIRHFRHEGSDVVCNGETDIHLRLKYAFADAFRFARSHRLPFDAEIEQKHNCPNGCCEDRPTWTRCSLTSYDDVQVEFRLSHLGQRFIPDCYLTDSTGENKPLFFEVRVTSKCSDAKVASGSPILEMIVRDSKTISCAEREQQCLEAIQQRLLPEKLIKWENFNLPKLADARCWMQVAEEQVASRLLKRNLQYTCTGMTLSPSEDYDGDGASGRILKTLTWFPWNGARILWDMEARQYLVIQNGVDHGVFPNHSLAYEFCQSRKTGKP